MLKIKEVAAIFNVRPLTIYKLIKRGLINSIRIGRSIRITEEEIERLKNTEVKDEEK